MSIKICLDSVESALFFSLICPALRQVGRWIFFVDLFRTYSCAGSVSATVGSTVVAGTVGSEVSVIVGSEVSGVVGSVVVAGTVASVVAGIVCAVVGGTVVVYVGCAVVTGEVVLIEDG